mmetsp:Transcript_15047/g.30955  ORF Transcript_15047/g.30955 Transcript_15047/m.30955 type:complete len:275 (+) Transcript_15047:794-1618(+)
MGRHKSNSKVLKNINVVSAPPTPTASRENLEVTSPAKSKKTKTSPKTKKEKTNPKKKKMAAFIDTFYNSFSSAGPRKSDRQRQSQRQSPRQSRSSWQQPKKENFVYAEIELLKVTAPKHDLEKFATEISRINRNVGIGVEISIMLPSRKHEERMREIEAKEKENHDFLDTIFSDKIPFLHEFLVYGSPEAQFFQIKGKKGDIDVFNKLCRQAIISKELQCQMEVTDRRQIPIKRKVEDKFLGTPGSEPDLLDSIFTDDFSKVSPFLHNILVSAF